MPIATYAIYEKSHETHIQPTCQAFHICIFETRFIALLGQLF